MKEQNSIETADSQPNSALPPSDGPACNGAQFSAQSSNQSKTKWSRSVFQATLAVCLTAMMVPAFAEKLRVVELFTSHGCSSCPRADDLLGKMIAADPELLLLEFHVDYWNSLVHGGDGNFVDPYSSGAYTERQRQYRQVSMRGRPGVYTPQAIINGHTAAVGSDRAKVSQALEQDTQANLSVVIEPASNDYQVKVSGNNAALGAAKGAQIVLLRYHRKRTTEITGGENFNRTLDNHNIVHDMKVLGTVGSSASMSFEVSANAEGDGCAILVQSPSLDRLHAATACP